MITVFRNLPFRVGKKLLFWFCEGLACVSGKTKCAIFAVGYWILKNVRWEKIKIQ